MDEQPNDHAKMALLASLDLDSVTDDAGRFRDPRHWTHEDDGTFLTPEEVIIAGDLTRPDFVRAATGLTASGDQWDAHSRTADQLTALLEPVCAQDPEVPLELAIARLPEPQRQRAYDLVELLTGGPNEGQRP